MKRVLSLLTFLDRQLLFLCSLLLLAFIPLFPKIPLFDVLPGYIVRVRIEDFLVIATGLVWIRDVFKKRIQWNTSYFWFVSMYAFVGFLSIFLGIFLLNTIPLELLHVGKSALHMMRYLEYFSVFFFLYSSITTRKHIWIALTVIVVTLLGVVAYGVGQKYAQFPVYSTMNREYSKGERLTLQEGARPQSTFAGHYDLAAYLVVILPILFSLSLGGIPTKSLVVRVVSTLGLQAVHFVGFGMLVLSGSKISLVGYVLGMMLVVGIHLLRLPSTRLRIQWASICIVCGVLAAFLGWQIAPAGTKEKVISLVSQNKGDQDRPTDLIGDGYEDKIITTAQPDGSETKTIVRVKSDWSENALKYGLSMGIRLDTLWPQATRGFARNPLTGSGFGTLSTSDTHAFAEADSTDNNFLRTLGETGTLGFLTFYGVVLLLAIHIVKQMKKTDATAGSLSIGFYGSMLGLLISAVYLDIFAASKVAFTFWSVAGLVVKSSVIATKTKTVSADMLQAIRIVYRHLQRHVVLYGVLLIAFFFLHQNPFIEQTKNLNIEQNIPALEQLTAARCFNTFKTLSLCRNSGLVLSSLFSLSAVYLAPFIKVLNNFGAYYYANITAFLAILIGVYSWLHTRVPKSSVFVGLLSLVALAIASKITQTPMTTIQFLCLVVGFPLLGIAIARMQTLLPKMVAKTLTMAIFAVCLFIGISSVRQESLPARFQVSPMNASKESVLYANAVVHPTASNSAYLLTTINPYYADLYPSKKYQVLPLSNTQAYADRPQNVWGISQTNNSFHSAYSQLLSQQSELFVSDYGVKDSLKYSEDFQALLDSYDLQYITFGCQEKCNIYSMKAEQEKISPNPVSEFDEREVNVEKLSDPYTFAVVSNVYNANLFPPPRVAVSTRGFAQKFGSISKAPFSFLTITGDVTHYPTKIYTDVFLDEFANTTSYPILYSAGNKTSHATKAFVGARQTFFSDSEYFLLLDVAEDSTITNEEKLRLYNTFLEIAKIPTIKTLFIISHDINWQDKSNPDNVVHLIQKKLEDLPQLETIIITANHAPDLVNTQEWYQTENDPNRRITYVASLTGQTTKDVYVQVSVDADGNVQLQGIKLAK